MEYLVCARHCSRCLSYISEQKKVKIVAVMELHPSETNNKQTNCKTKVYHRLVDVLEEALNWVSAIRSEGGGWGWGAGCNLNKMPRVRFTERVRFEQDWN